MPIKHIAIIPDGNRRWAKKRKLPPIAAYKIATNQKRAREICLEAKKQKVQVLSIWGFSTENWKRSKDQVKEIFNVIENSLDDLSKNHEKDKFRFIHIGRKDRIPKLLVKKIQYLEKVTAKYKEFTIILGIDYGGRDEIIRAINKAKKTKSQVTETQFSKLLDTKDIPDPDILIRTGGEKRLSGFMPFQIVYTEFYFLNMLFPEFQPHHLTQVIHDFHKRKRKFGK
ncbi:MAG: di-trans,poly-cis-decaprenylcistransferase [Nanoarchaeota archaeon]|nr:di-trans,poly-cis-decaprenylcistransferase [Nanoarchaeota archaeon]